MRMRWTNLFLKAGLACAIGMALPSAAMAAGMSLEGPATVAENATKATYTVKCGDTPNPLLPALAVPNQGTLTVTVADGPAPATSPEDRGAPSQTSLTCTLATTEFTFDVPIANDTLDEPNEQFTVTVSGSLAAEGEVTKSVTTAITDDDVPSARIIELVPVIEADSGAVDALLTVTLDQTPIEDATLGYTTEKASAEPGQDYTERSGSLVIPAGQTTGTIAVPIVGDTTPEKVEAFYVKLVSANKATLNAEKLQGGVAIFDNDKPPLPVISVPQSVTVKEGNAGAGNVLFEVSLNAPATQTTEVSWRTTDWTAKGNDFRAASGKLTFSPGQRTKTISVNVKGDTTDEPDEAFGLVLENPVNATLARKGAFGIITDDDGPKVRIGKAKRTAKRLVVTVACPATATKCTGRLVGKAGSLKLGRAKFDLAKGRSAKLKLKLSKKARKALAKRGRRGKLTATAADASGAKRVTVRKIRLKKR